jgi:2-iminoacetate synthase
LRLHTLKTHKKICPSLKQQPSGPKSDYPHRILTMDRAMRAGLDDVGIGALFGLADYRYGA